VDPSLADKLGRFPDSYLSVAGGWNKGLIFINGYNIVRRLPSLRVAMAGHARSCSDRATILLGEDEQVSPLRLEVVTWTLFSSRGLSGSTARREAWTAVCMHNGYANLKYLLTGVPPPPPPTPGFTR